MKKHILLLLMVLSIGIVKAISNKPTDKIKVYSNFNDAVTFTERGIEFHVFFNGDFDFNTHTNHHRNRFNNGVNIDRDYNGRIRRVGNVFINYDLYGNVSRIGNVFMNYRRGYLSRVGNLIINYDRWGRPHFRGYVKPYRDNYFLNTHIDINIFDYNDDLFYRKDFKRNYRKFKEDNNFYYYRVNPNAKGNKGKVLKRRKRSINKKNRKRKRR